MPRLLRHIATLKRGPLYCCTALCCVLGAQTNLAAETDSVEQASANTTNTGEMAAPAKEHQTWRFNLGISVAHGGDDLIHAQFEDGSSGKIRAGNGAALYLGTFIDRENSPIDFLINGGLIQESKNAEEGNADLRKFFIDTLLLYRVHRKHRLGLGISTHFLSSLDVEDLNNSIVIDFEPAAGITLQYEYIVQLRSKAIPSIGLRYTDISYDIENSSERIDASHYALSLNLSF